MLTTVLLCLALKSVVLPKSIFWPVRPHTYPQILAGSSNASHRQIMNEIENQNRNGPCGSCWAYTVSTLIEARIAQQHGLFVEVSPEHVLDCTSGVELPGISNTNQGCTGGFEGRTIELLTQNDFVVCEENSYTSPWTFDKSKCKERTEACHGVADVKTAEIVRNPSLDKSKLMEMVSKGPTGAFIFTSPAFRSYFNGNETQIWDTQVNLKCSLGPSIYTNYNTECGPHAVVLVGYGTLNGRDYWTIANSWGTEWGNHGYAKIQRGTNMLGIESVRAVRITSAKYKSVLPQKSESTTVNVNVNTADPGNTTNSGAATAGLVVVLVLCALLSSFYCLAWPMDYYPVAQSDAKHIPEALPVSSEQQPRIVVIRAQSDEQRSSKTPQIQMSPMPLAVPFPGPAAPKPTPAPTAPPAPNNQELVLKL